MRQAYLDLQNKQREEHEAFPIAYAFSEKQLAEALESIGASSVSECVTIMGMGDIVKKTDAKRYKEMLRNHTKEMQAAMLDENFAEAAFLYEMDNHEYAINYDGDAEVLACFGMDYEMLVEMNLENAYRRARKKHMDHAREWY